MKRSEMLDQLKKCFHEYSPDYGLDYVFERMLKRAENLGMLPPAYKYIDDHLPCWDNVIIKNEWEPENEEE